MQGDLPTVVQAVLDDAVKQMVEIVLAAGNDLLEALIAESFDGLG